MNKKSLITYSRLRSFLVCPRREYYEYRVKDVGIELVKEPKYFIEGNFFHALLKDFYENKSINFEKISQKVLTGLQQTEIGEEEYLDIKRSLIIFEGVAKAYEIIYQKDFEDYEVLGIEKQFVLDCFEGISYGGKIDLIVKDKKGEIGVIEHKLVSSFSCNIIDAIPLNLQLYFYIKGVEHLFGKCNWVIFNFVRKSGYKIRNSEKETEESFKERVKKQYLLNKEEMFFRTSPYMIEKEIISYMEKDIKEVINNFKKGLENSNIPIGNYTSCFSMYNYSCPFIYACLALSRGHPSGWDAPECIGYYKLKETPFNKELEKGE